MGMMGIDQVADVLPRYFGPVSGRDGKICALNCRCIHPCWHIGVVFMVGVFVGFRMLVERSGNRDDTGRQMDGRRFLAVQQGCRRCDMQCHHPQQEDQGRYYCVSIWIYEPEQCFTFDCVAGYTFWVSRFSTASILDLYAIFEDAPDFGNVIFVGQNQQFVAL